ncbi:MAG: sulfurtransferase complex subunit TusC [Methylococcaceae bacterium]|nr:sulfurtransferase complex subunit TusC [Methylococcaceae bacterium]
MRTSPHNGVQLQEKLDVILTAAAFDQHVSLLFLDDGVFQLKKEQKAEKYGLKDTQSIFNVLEIYDIHDLYVETESLLERGFQTTNLSLSVEVCYRKDVNELMKQHDLVLSG